jgi:hypothetical protein
MKRVRTVGLISATTDQGSDDFTPSVAHQHLLTQHSSKPGASLNPETSS